MTNEDFARWKELLGFTFADTAHVLGLGRTTVESYRHGYRREEDRGEAVLIPKPVALACSAVALGLPPYGEGLRLLDERQVLIESRDRAPMIVSRFTLTERADVDLILEALREHGFEITKKGS